jgi:nitrite reductase/ring-hydroxylating ferredoxin subunit
MKPKTPEAWRQDFPVDWPLDHYVARRDFVKFLVLTSMGFTAGQLCIGVDQLLKSGQSSALPRMRLCGKDELAVGETRAFTYPGEHDPCLLVRVDDSRWVAYGQKCTHLSCAVVPQPEKNRLFCPCHNGAFDLESGRPIQGPPRRPLPRIELEITDDEVYATGVHLSTS